MTTLSVPTISLDEERPAQRLRRSAAAVRVSLRWWGVHRALTGQQKEELGAATAADARLLTAGKKLIDVRHEAFRRLTAIRTRLGTYWRGITLPFPEPGVRLLRQADVESFVHALEGFRDELSQAESALQAVYPQLQDDARQRLGRLYNPADYPLEIRDLFAVSWSFPSVEPPSYLLRLAPEVYEEERRRVASRFDEAVRLAEQAFASEFARLLAHLTERLAPGPDGQRRVFRDSVVTSLQEFFARFAQLNVRSNPELDALVEQARQVVQGLTPQDLRGEEGLRQQITAAIAQVQTQVEGLIIDAPRRRLIRTRPRANGENHAAAN